MTVTLYKWTLDRYHAAIDAGLFDEQAVELLQGDIVVMAPEREPHACYSSVGAEYLRQLSRHDLPRMTGLVIAQLAGNLVVIEVNDRNLQPPQLKHKLRLCHGAQGSGFTQR